MHFEQTKLDRSTKVEREKTNIVNISLWLQIEPKGGKPYPTTFTFLSYQTSLIFLFMYSVIGKGSKHHIITKNCDQSKLDRSAKFEGEKADAVNLSMRVKLELDRSEKVFE